MGESNIPVTRGSGDNVDTFTLSGTGNKRQSVVVGDSTTDGNVAPVQATDPSSSTQGLVVRDVNTSAIVRGLNSSLAVGGDIANNVVDGGYPVKIGGQANSNLPNPVSSGNRINAWFSTLGALIVSPIIATGSSSDSTDQAQTATAGSSAVTNPIGSAIYVFNSSSKWDRVRGGSGVSNSALRVVNATDVATSVNIIGITTSMAVGGDIANNATDDGYPIKIGGQANSSIPTSVSSGKRVNSWHGVSGNLMVGILSGNTNTGADTLGHAQFMGPNGASASPIPIASYTFDGSNWNRSRGGSGVSSMAQRVVHATDVATSVNIVGIGTSNTLGVYIDSTKGTLIIKPDPAGTFFTNGAHTASIFTVSGNNSSAVSVSGNTIISPSANYNFKIYAFQLTSTAQSNILVKFTNGAGTSPTEFWRYPMQAPSQGFAGANLAVTPPGYIFATGTSTTLALVTDSASLVHYSISYIKETA